MTLLTVVGPLRIYRQENGQCCMNSGIHFNLSFLPKSECWCVDDISKFALKRGPMIYRVELPNETEEDKSKVESLKEVLSGIILYEKTICPFNRSVTKELPVQDSETPYRRTLIEGKQRVHSLDLGSPPNSSPISPTRLHNDIVRQPQYAPEAVTNGQQRSPPMGGNAILPVEEDTQSPKTSRVF